MHLFTGERAGLLGACGSPPEQLSGFGGTAQSYYQSARGWTTNHPLRCPDYAVTFVHEIGHGLGADHDPANATDPDRTFRPYAFGHADLDVMPSLGTAMSYQGQVEPFFSTPRLRPWGAILGIADERDNERTLQETVHIAVRTATTCGRWMAFRRRRAIFGSGSRAARRMPPGGTTRRTRTGTRWTSTVRDEGGRTDRRRQMVKGRTGAVLPLSPRNRGPTTTSWSER